MTKKEKFYLFISVIILILSVIWLIKVTIPYYQLDIESKRAIIEMAK